MRKPIPELVVAPSIVIASPILGITKERTKLIKVIKKVAMTFYLLLSFVFSAKNSSSIVSLHGRSVKGVANKTTVRIPKSEIKFATLFG